MALVLSRVIDLIVSSDAARANVIAQRRPSLSDSVTLTKSVEGSRTVAVSTNLQIDLGGVSAMKVLYIETDKAVIVRGGEALDGITVAPPASGQTAVLCVEGSLDELWIENESASDVANVYYFVAGT